MTSDEQGYLGILGLINVRADRTELVDETYFQLLLLDAHVLPELLVKK